MIAHGGGTHAAGTSEHGGDLGLDASRLAVAGESVGGYMTAVVAQLANERKGLSIHY
jgi:acetyl esterase